MIRIRDVMIVRTGWCCEVCGRHATVRAGERHHQYVKAIKQQHQKRNPIGPHDQTTTHDKLTRSRPIHPPIQPTLISINPSCTRTIRHTTLRKVTKHRKPKEMHSRNRSSRQRLQERQLLPVVALSEHVLLQMPIRREVDRGEGDVAEQTRARALVQPEQSELSYDMNRALRYSAFDLRSFTLHLQTDLPVHANVRQTREQNLDGRRTQSQAGS